MQYRHQLRADEARIEAEAATIDALDIRMAEVAGRFRALAKHYACCADLQAAQLNVLRTDPMAFVAAWSAQTGGPSAHDVAALLTALHAYLTRCRPELKDVADYVEEAAACADYQALEEEREAEEASEHLEWQIEQGLIGRSIMKPEAP